MQLLRDKYMKISKYLTTPISVSLDNLLLYTNKQHTIFYAIFLKDNVYLISMFKLCFSLFNLSAIHLRTIRAENIVTMVTRYIANIERFYLNIYCIGFKLN